jgi:hypothetical protein
VALLIALSPLKESSKEISMLWFIFQKPQDVVVMLKQESRHFFRNAQTIKFLC